MDRNVKAPRQSDLDLSEWGWWITAGAVAGLAEGASASLRLGEALYGAPHQPGITWQPLNLAIELATHEVVWSGPATAGAVTLAAGAVGLAGSVWALKSVCDHCRKGLAGRRRIRREAVDKQARYMGRGKQLAGLSRKAVARKASQLKVRLEEGAQPGVMIGRAVAGGQALYASYEDLHLDIWGPRQGKSTSRVIPAIMEAPGPVATTSNKRDVVDATRAARAQRGDVHVFDPQGVAEEPCTWFWDPIAWVWGTDGDGAQERAAELAGHFADGDENSRSDAFFEPEGEDLLSGLFLACALSRRPITQAFAWVTNTDDREPIQILDDGGFDLVSAALSAQYYAPEKQRSGVFGTAKKMTNCLKFQRVRPWVTPPAKGERPRRAFDVDAFVTSSDTLYCLSEEAKGSAGPLITAFAAAVADAGKREGIRCGGRLPVPLLIALDEAANIVRWRELPKQYSHFGSRGIVVMTVLQSWAQGVRCWGADGMEALWSASTVKVLGSGLDGAAFLRDRSELIGPHYELVNSVTRGRDGSRSVSTNRTSEITMHASDLANLPRGRMVVFAAGHPPTLAAAVPWMVRPYAQQISDALKDVERVNRARAKGRHLRVVPRVTDQKGKSA
ncbi:type IV secretory system conjugative DNA transfer family protein [Nocardia sp. NPDC051570]|uniref:type IV secretory system conjugative DNA transfer family protein n=1 Tax=Nocardia sp. NPDC051570 TaxID=3364324 RepID=UPI0037889F3C